MTENPVVQAFAPAKINLTLHVTGRRADGYHLLDSLVMFADVGDRITASAAAETTLEIDGPKASSIPTGADNIVFKAARLMGVTADIRLEKNLPAAAGIGGGSTDAAATLRALSELSGVALPKDSLSLGADVPVCLSDAGAARMQGVGDQVTAVHDLPVLNAVLVNPNIPVLTANVFANLKSRDNPPMPDTLPQGASTAELIEWLRGMRNDLEPAAIEAEPVIAQVFSTLEVTPGCLLARMSGAGGTCFGLYNDAETAAAAAGRLQEQNPGWWVVATQLNAPR